MESQNYNVEFDVFCERYYIKVFEKKHRGKWVKTRFDIEDVCKHIDTMLEYKRADLISSIQQYKLVKLDFAIEGIKISPKKSGNRCILFINEDTKQVRILLVYSKNDICEPNETAKWKKIIKNQFADISDIFSL